MSERTLQGSLTFLGFAIGIIATFYFAFEYIPRVSDWTQLAALILLGLFFAFLGVWLQSTVVGEPFFEGPRLRWLRPAIVLYLLALLCGVVAEFVFLGIDDVPRPVKILASLVIALVLIIGVARRRTAHGEGPPKPRPATKPGTRNPPKRSRRPAPSVRRRP